MAQTRTYSDLITLIQALFGANFISTELTRVKALINSRAWNAYRRSQLWESFLVIGEEQTVDDSVAGNLRIPYQGALSAESTITATANEGDADTFLRIHGENRPWTESTPVEFQFQADNTGARLVNYAAIYGQGVTVSNAVATSGTLFVTVPQTIDIYVGGTVALSSMEEPSSIDDTINTTHTIDNITYSGSNQQVEIDIDDNSIYSWSLTGSELLQVPTAYATYKKRLSGTTYGDGDGETSAIPQEWFEYIAHSVAADMYRADGDHMAAQLEQDNADEKLKHELARLDAMHTSQTILNRVRTHGTEATSTIYS